MQAPAVSGGSGAARRAPRPTVADVMRAPVVTVTPETTVGEARLVQRRARIRHLPVIEGDLLAGIVSDRDLRGARDDSVKISRVMTRTVFVLSPATPLRDAARTFRQRRFGAMPVLSGRALVGMVSLVDVARVLEERLSGAPHTASC